ncbi:ribbon-helix-helix protein, CopG family [Dietzia sp. CQ4]|uniref:type II toxin-antitoxin system RelB family antitoxin n=1 Tax=Dietzia sp. (strain CQ4) TaxID=370437 RepID=UPI0015FE1787|nr:ribbon-helix-helix protein, CopG family [Dietzia sp. CQ4]MBB1033576.1 ribbon-helix-helix protein, CopG family [Dietzia sp. CQ4]
MSTTARLPRDLEERLARVAKGTGRPKSHYLRALLEENIERLEWEAELQQKVADIRAGRRQTYTLDEVEAERDLAE